MARLPGLQDKQSPALLVEGIMLASRNKIRLIPATEDSVDDNTKQVLLSQFSAWLDAAEDEATLLEEPTPSTDLYSLFVEMAGLRGEVRTESRLVKEALDQFRDVFDTLRSSQATVRQELNAHGPKPAIRRARRCGRCCWTLLIYGTGYRPP